MKMSESVANIAAALSKFQAEVKNPANTADNPFYKSKYAPLPEILNIVRPILAKHGLSIVQMPSGDGENITVTTLLLHESGEYIEACPLTLRADKTTAQGAGSAITYGRRYAVAAMLGISSEDDDDGNIASKPEQGQKPQPKPKAVAPKKDGEIPMANEGQIRAISSLGKMGGINVLELLQKTYGASKPQELTYEQAGTLIKDLQKFAKEGAQSA